MKGSKIIKIGLLVYALIFILICCKSFACYKKNIAPLETKFTFGDTNCTAKTNYNPKTRIISLKLITEQKIEPWQKEILKNEKLILKLMIDEEELKQKSYILENGKNLEVDYEIQNASVGKYINCKTALLRDGSMHVQYNKVLSFSKKDRNEAKKEYNKIKELQRQQAIQRKKALEYQRQLEQFYRYYW